MSWYAIESVDAAAATIRRFLLPLGAAAWGKLAIVALFLSLPGGTAASVSLSGSLTSAAAGEYLLADLLDPDRAAEDVIAEELPAAIAEDEAIDEAAIDEAALDEAAAALAEAIAAIDPTTVLAALAGLAVILLAIAIAVETFRFVFYDAIREHEVELVDPIRERFGQAIRLLGFKVGVVLVYSVPIVVLLWLSATTGAASGLLPGTGGPGLALAGLYTAVGGLLVLLVVRFTNEFVVPIMTLTDSSVLAGWRKLWPTVRSEWPQFLLYLIVHAVLVAAIRVAQSVVASIIFAVVAATAAVAGIVLVFGIAGSVAAAVESAVILAGLGSIGLLGLIAIVLLMLPIRILVISYVAIYELSVLRRAEDSFDLLATIEAEAATPASDAPQTN